MAGNTDISQAHVATFQLHHVKFTEDPIGDRDHFPFLNDRHRIPPPAGVESYFHLTQLQNVLCVVVFAVCSSAIFGPDVGKKRYCNSWSSLVCLQHKSVCRLVYWLLLIILNYWVFHYYLSVEVLVHSLLCLVVCVGVTTKFPCQEEAVCSNPQTLTQTHGALQQFPWIWFVLECVTSCETHIWSSSII